MRRKIEIKPRVNWSKDQKDINEIDPEELKKYKSDYIPPENPLVQSYNLQDSQKKLFRELMPKDVSIDRSMLAAPSGDFPQALPVVRRESSTYYYRGFVPGVRNILLDNSKLKRKIYIPKHNGFNYAGIIIGPRGANQKRLEEETGCKILVRGRGSQKEGQPTQTDDWEALHVLVAADSEEQLAVGCGEIEKILCSDEQTRNIIRQEQLKAVAKIRNNEFAGSANFSYDFKFANNGIANANAYIIPVPNEAVGLVIGMGGETLKEIQMQSEAYSLHIAPDSAPGCPTRNLYVEGSEEAFFRARKLVEEIVGTQLKMRAALTDGSKELLLNMQISVPVPSLPLVVGRESAALQRIAEASGARLVFAPTQSAESSRRTLLCSGTTGQVIKAKHEIDLLLARHFPGEVSTLSYSSRSIRRGEESEQEARERRGLFEGEIRRGGAQQLVVTDKGSNYYADLKEYFGLGLDFLGEAQRGTVVQVKDFYPDGRVLVHFYS